MKKLLLSALLLSSIAHASEGVITLKSNHDVNATAGKLVEGLNNKGMTVFARINHEEGAKKVGQTLNPTELVIFGNPKVGTPLMQCEQRVALDLPQKALIWQDSEGTVWFSYNDPQYLGKRHNIQGCEKVLEKISGALAKFAETATK